MRVLIAPMAAMAETSGPFSRAKALAQHLLQQGHSPAFCAAPDVNYQPVPGVPNYAAPLPSPMGLPMVIGKRMLGIAQRLGLQQRRKVTSFEDVLFIVGAIHPNFFGRDVAALRQAIREFKPYGVYAEFRPAAIVAARLEGVPVATGYSYPARKAYASSPRYAGGVRAFLKSQGLPPVESVLELFEWADLKIVPSCPRLEPLDDPRVAFTGPFSSAKPAARLSLAQRDALVVYMGNGSIGYSRQLSVLTQAFQGKPQQVYIASYQAPTADYGNIHVARRFDFQALLPRAIAMIHHGGQNSLITAVLNETPQIIFPGSVFERQYNADSVARLGLALRCADDQFQPAEISRLVAGFQVNEKALQDLKAELLGLGGVETAAQCLLELCRDKAAV